MMKFLPVLLLASAAGCDVTRYAGPELRQQGLVVVVPGVGGVIWDVKQMVEGLHDGGAAGSIEVFDWAIPPAPFTYMLNHWMRSRQRPHAARLATLIADHRRRHPNAPVRLLAASGGSGIALYALEALPPDAQVDDVVLICSAVSPDFDLTLALSHVRGELVSHHSDHDTMMALGTTLAGTFEGLHTPAAGAVPFRLPPNASPQSRTEYAKLKQIPWNESFVVDGNHGGHMGPTAYAFVRNRLAPLFRAKAGVGDSE